MDRSNKRNLLRNHSGLFQVQLIEHEKQEKREYGVYSRFKIIDSPKLPNSVQKVLSTYLNGYGCAQYRFSEDYNELAEFHDRELQSWARNLNTQERASMLKHLITQEPPVQSKLEIESMNWLSTLSQQELKYARWVKMYFEEIDKMLMYFE